MAKALLAPEAEIGDGEEVAAVVETATMLEVVPITPAGTEVGTAAGTDAAAVELTKTGAVVGITAETTGAVVATATELVV